MKAVLDTNILFSAAISVGTSHKVVLAAINEAVFEILICGQQLQELRDVMLRPSKKYRFMPGEADGYLTVLYNDGIVIPDLIRSGINHTRDPKDDYLIDLAIQGQADVLVSNDEHLLELSEVMLETGKIPIITARQFLTFFERSGLLKNFNQN
jgi:putative PIN family toxin of toxin-antitoxin system